MCTVSWFTTPKGYELFFNRDESKKRTEALPPEILSGETCEFLSPTDVQGGGSWVATNQFGVTVCLLNLYTDIDLVESDHYVSRGEIIREIAGISSINAVYEHISNYDLSEFRTFRVFAIDVSGKNILLAWNGQVLSVENDTLPPKSSSSVDTLQVVSGRKALFKNAGLDKSKNRADFLAYQRGHEPNKNYSVCVHREFTKTVSMSHIVVDNDTVKFDYFNGSPCECKQPVSSKLSRMTIDCQSDVA